MVLTGPGLGHTGLSFFESLDLASEACFSNLTDPHTFNSDLANRVEWKNMKWGGWNLCTHRLKRKSTFSSTSYRFELANEAKYACYFFIGMPLTLCVFAWRAAGYDAVSEAIGFLSLMSLFFAWMLVWLRWREFSFYPYEGWCGRSRRRKIGINDIGALQILSHKNINKKGSYYSFELNLVFNDATRLNVVNHNAMQATRDDAAILSAALRVPVWDAIEESAEKWGLKRGS